MSSDFGHRSFKNPSMSENLPSSRIPMFNRVMPSNFEVPPSNNFNDGTAFHDTRKPWVSGRGIGIQEGPFEVCRLFHSGRKCTYGDQCRFLHEIPERIKKDFGLPSQSNEVGMSAGGHIVDRRSGFDQLEEKKLGQMRIDGRNEIPKPVFFKTRFCFHWRMTGQCPYEVCRFAHGEAELQKPGGCSLPEWRGVYNTSATTSASEAELSNTGMGNDSKNTFVKKENDSKNMVSRVKRLFKSNEPVKLIGVYADWLED